MYTQDIDTAKLMRETGVPPEYIDQWTLRLAADKGFMRRLETFRKWQAARNLIATMRAEQDVKKYIMLRLKEWEHEVFKDSLTWQETRRLMTPEDFETFDTESTKIMMLADMTEVCVMNINELSKRYHLGRSAITEELTQALRKASAHVRYIMVHGDNTLQTLFAEETEKAETLLTNKARAVNRKLEQKRQRERDRQSRKDNTKRKGATE